MVERRKTQINYNRPFIVGKELYNIARAVIDNKKLSGDGEFTRYCQQWLVDNLRCKSAFLTHSCTAALEMAAILCNIEPGDEIIMPSFTFVSTANAFVLRGGTPVFVDIRPDTLNIDEKVIQQAISNKTKAIVPVHYAGIPCEMDIICEIAKSSKLYVIEDAAQALLSSYKNKYLGTFGDFAALSFHETKNIISGEGGALLINNDKFVDRCEVIWEKGTNRKEFFRGEVDKYTWVDIGSSFLPSEMVSAFLAAQFEHANEIIANRRKAFQKYYDLLIPLEKSEIIRLPHLSSYDTCNGHIFFIITRSAKEQQALIKHLNETKIKAIFHYIPLHSSPAGKKYGKYIGKLKNTDSLSKRVIRLPLYYNIEPKDIERIVHEIFTFFKAN